MKKRLFFIVLMVALACLFAVSVSAENKIIKLDTLPTLEEINANPSAYVSHLDAFDESSYKEKDDDSVVVMSDLQETPTYYVFPSFYILERTSYFPDVTALNTAVAGADSTAFSSYAATGSRGGNKHIIRIEIPTFITRFDGWCKFEGSANLKEIYFPTRLVVDEATGLEKEVSFVTVVEGQNTFTGCSKLEYVHNVDKLPLSVWNQGSFGGCSSLLEVTLPKGLTSIPKGLFEGCYKLGNVEIPDGVTSIGLAAFENCDSMTEMILPNSVVTITKRCFNNMNSLEVISFGAGLTTLESTDHNLELISSCPNIKYIYMPATFATTVQGTGHSILSSGTKVTIFFTGTEAQAEAIRTKLTESASNPLIKDATFVEYDQSIDYSTYAQTLGYTVLVYDYSACEAFNNGEHKVSESYSIEYSGVKLLSNATRSKACANCSYKVDLKELAPLFESLGYSSNRQGSVVQGFSVNRDVIADYEAALGAIEFGVVAAGDTREDKTVGADIFSLDKYLSSKLSTGLHKYFDVKVSGFTEADYGKSIFFCAYVKFGEECYYIDNGKVGQTAVSVTYNDITNK